MVSAGPARPGAPWRAGGRVPARPGTAGSWAESRPGARARLPGCRPCGDTGPGRLPGQAGSVRGRPWPGMRGHSDGPAGWVWLGGLQPRPLCLLHPLDHRTALHRQRPWDPPVFPASGIRSYHPRGGRAATAAIYRYFHNVRHVEEQETCQEIRLKAQLGR